MKNYYFLHPEITVGTVIHFWNLPMTHKEVYCESTTIIFITILTLTGPAPRSNSASHYWN